uniref:Uncharacterized protein n=1 Tax=Macaca fascicularis TaxID=9541 RepID=A0A7N9D2A4_MACFA
MKRSFEQVENAGAIGPSRFGLKRAEVLGHKTPEPAPRRTEITLVKPQESAHRRMEPPASKIPEVAAPLGGAHPKDHRDQVHHARSVAGAGWGCGMPLPS